MWTVAKEDASSLQLTPGASVDEALAQAIECAADAEAAVRTGLRALARRAFARADLARRLVKKGHPAAAVAVALDRLAARGLLDDLAFARSFAETRTARGRGPARIRRDLLAMGVGDAVVRAAVAESWSSDDDVAERALALARSRAPRLAGLPRQAQRRRLLAFLTRRGFTGVAAGRAITQVVR
jgi:regulatory protein